MSLLEGFSDYVMDEVGRDLVPDVERISAKFHERRHARRSPFERAVMRLTGMDVKLEQYRKGERVRLGDRRGRRTRGPQPAVGRARRSLPRHGEIDDPAAWLAGRTPRRRVTDAAAGMTDDGSAGRRARAPARAARRRRSPCRRSCRPATGRATSSGSARRRPAPGS